MYHHPNTVALSASASAPAMFGQLWLAIGLVTLFFAVLALKRLVPRDER